jgi:hypothetical protein
MLMDSFEGFVHSIGVAARTTFETLCAHHRGCGTQLRGSAGSRDRVPHWQLAGRHVES